MRLQQKTLPTGATVATTYNDAALTASATMNYVEAGQNRSITTSGVYNGWGQATQRLDAASNLVNIAYDSMQRVCAQTNPFAQGGQPGPSTTYSYDGLGRVRVTTLPDTVNTIQYSYSGTTRTITDQVNRQIKQETDGLSRIVKVTEKDANGQLTQETSYTHSVLDKLVEVNQGGQLRSFKYDALGRLLFERIPEQSATINDGSGTFWSSKHTWTDFHATSTRQDARGAVTSYGYDVLNRLTSVSYDTSGAPGVAATNNVAYNHDTSQTSTTKGLLLSITMTGPLAAYTETFSYDSFERMSSRTWSRDGLSYTISYQFNTANQATQMIYPVSGRVLNITHDSVGRVATIADQYRTYINNFSHNAAGQVTGLNLGNGVSESYGYDANRLQLTSQTATQSGGATGGLLNLTYGYQASAGQMGTGSTAGNASQLMAISGTIGGLTEASGYTYDNLGRLVTSSQASNSASAQRRFAYDRWGNRTGVWDATTGGNQIQSIALQQTGGAPTNQIASVTVGGVTKNHIYDAAGNLINDGVHTYEYDAENRVKSVDNLATAAYAYDYQNRRIKKVAGGAITNYVWEGNQVIGEHDGATGAVIYNYVYSGSRMIARMGSGIINWYLSDRLSARLVLDGSGNVIGRQAHLPFGEDFGEGGTQEKHHFTSYERDGESGMDYAINRGYSPTVGRFQSTDAYRGSGDGVVPQTWNRYAYVKNDPGNAVDPLGLESCALYGVFHEILLEGVVISSTLIFTFSVCQRAAAAKASGSGGGGGAASQQMARLPDNLRARLRKLLEKDNNKCGDFVQNLINQVAKDTGHAPYSTSILEVFDAISSLGGYVLEQLPPPTGGTIRGSLVQPSPTQPATVVISPQPHAGSPFNENAVQNAYTSTALHETIHLTGNYGDGQLATAVFNLLRNSLSESEIDEYNNLDRSINAPSSKFWDRYLNKHCAR